ncbi:MAG: BON domain-containing protein [Pirellulaceae bacterium]
MRRFLFGVVIASVAAAMPSWAYGGDRDIAKAVMSQLQQHKAAGSLKGFDLDMQVEDGIVYLDGRVASREQRDLVARAAAYQVGINNIVNDLKVVSPAKSSGIRPVTRIKPGTAVKQASSRPARKLESKSTAVRPAAAKAPAKPIMRDSDITDAVIGKLQQLKNSGKLRGFELDVNTAKGDLWLTGSVANSSQKKMVLDAARRVSGVSRVVDDIKVGNQMTGVRTASTGGLAPSNSAPVPVPQVSSMPSTGSTGMGPQAFAPSALASAPMGYSQGGVPGGQPVAMQGGQFGGGAPRYDQPNMPGYAWPSYAAQSNYAAVSYPKQYSPSAWPYIGPFYPYPQVPLGWRKVALEWDDGLWYLDFTSK